MSPNAQKYGLIAIKTALALAFAAAGLAKLTGAEMMVQTFDAVGVGQWFRYLTGLIEVAGAILLWVPGIQFIGAGLLTCTMIGAVLAHLFILGTATMAPALVLGVLSAIVAFAHRNQSPLSAIGRGCCHLKGVCSECRPLHAQRAAELWLKDRSKS